VNITENVNYESDSNGHVGNICVYAPKKSYPKKVTYIKFARSRAIVIRVTIVKSTKFLCRSKLLMSQTADYIRKLYLHAYG